MKLLVTLLGILTVLFVALFIVLSIFNSPTYAWRILRYGQSDVGDINIFPKRTIANGETASLIERGEQGTPYEVEFPYKDEMRKEVLEDLINRTGTHAFLILKDDKLIYETYLESSRDEINTSFSSAKSFNSALIGAAIAEGKIESVNDPVIQYVPEIAGRGFDRLAIRDLLLMNSGIRYVEGDELPFYYEPFTDDALTYYPPDLRKVALRVEASGAP